MRKQYLILCLILITSLGCSPCKQLQQKDAQIGQKFQSLKAKNLPITDARYRTKLNALYAREQRGRTCIGALNIAIQIRLIAQVTST